MHSLTGLRINSPSKPPNYNTLSYSLMCNLHSILRKLLYCFLELYLTQTLLYLLSLRYLIRFAVLMFSHNIHKLSLPENFTNSTCYNFPIFGGTIGHKSRALYGLTIGKFYIQLVQCTQSCSLNFRVMLQSNDDIDCFDFVNI